MRTRTQFSTMATAALALALAAGLSSTWIACAQDRAAVETGARLFTVHGCHGCHRVGALGTPIGPDLSRVGAKYREADLVRWLTDPASQKPRAHMPKLELSTGDITALAAYLAAQR